MKHIPTDAPFRNGTISRDSLPLRYCVSEATPTTSLLKHIPTDAPFRNGTVSRDSLPLRNSGPVGDFGFTYAMVGWGAVQIFKTLIFKHLSLQRVLFGHKKITEKISLSFQRSDCQPYPIKGRYCTYRYSFTHDARDSQDGFDNSDSQGAAGIIGRVR